MSFPANDAGLASGLLCGVLFGYVLENAGFGNPCKLTAQFKLSDWSVFKVMFTAIVVAALGLQILAQGDLLQYFGLAKRSDVKDYGHIPGARVFPSDVQVKTEGGVAKFLPSAAYKSVLEQSGIRTTVPAITYCNTGHLGSGAWFVMSEILKMPHVRLYDGSMMEWTLGNRPTVSVPER